MNKKILLTLALATSVSQATDWATSEVDQGNKSFTASVPSSDKNAPNLNVTITEQIVDGKVQVTPLFELADKSTIKCKKGDCSISYNFDGHDKQTNAWIPTSATAISPLAVGSFARAMHFAKHLSIGIPQGESVYKYEIDLPEVKTEKPTSKMTLVDGLAIGEQESTIPASFTHLSDSGDDCYESGESIKIRADLSIKARVIVCARQSVIYSISASNLYDKDFSRLKFIIQKTLGKPTNVVGNGDITAWNPTAYDVVSVVTSRGPKGSGIGSVAMFDDGLFQFNNLFKK